MQYNGPEQIYFFSDDLNNYYNTNVTDNSPIASSYWRATSNL